MRTCLAAVLAALVLATTATAGEPEPTPADTPQIVFEVRVLAVSDSLFFERVGIDFQTQTEAPAVTRSRQVPEAGVLTDAQLKVLLDAAQGDRRANVLQAPKITTENGKEAAVSATEQRGFVTRLEAVSVKGEPVLVPKETQIETGMKFAVTGRVSADGKTVETRFKYTDTRVVGEVPLVPVVTQIKPVLKNGSRGKPVPFTQYLQVPQTDTVTIEKADLAIPAGGHAVLVGPAQMRETRQEFGPPFLSKVPYLNRMFKNVGVGRETVRTAVIVSAKVLTLKD